MFRRCIMAAVGDQRARNSLLLFFCPAFIIVIVLRFSQEVCAARWNFRFTWQLYGRVQLAHSYAQILRKLFMTVGRRCVQEKKKITNSCFAWHPPVNYVCNACEGHDKFVLSSKKKKKKKTDKKCYIRCIVLTERRYN